MRISQHSEKEAPRPRSMPRAQMPSPEFSASRCAARSQFSDSVDISRPVFGTPSMKPGRPGEAALGASTGEGLPLNVRPNARGDSAAAARGAARHAGWITADALAYPARPRLHPWAPCHRALHNPAPQPNPTRPGPLCDAASPAVGLGGQTQPPKGERSEMMSGASAPMLLLFDPHMALMPVPVRLTCERAQRRQAAPWVGTVRAAAAQATGVTSHRHAAANARRRGQGPCPGPLAGLPRGETATHIDCNTHGGQAGDGRGCRATFVVGC